MRIGFRHCLLLGCLLLAKATATGTMFQEGQPGRGSEPTGWPCTLAQLHTHGADSHPLYETVLGPCEPWDQQQPCLCPAGLRVLRCGLCVNTRGDGHC